MQLYIILSVISLLLSVALIPLIRKLAYRNGWVDKPNHRKVHNGNIPRLGGIAIAASFFIIILAGTLIFTDEITISDYWPLIIGMAIIFLTGLVDDFINLPALSKLLLQMIAAAVVIFSGHVISVIPIPFTDLSITFPVITYLVTFLWIIGITNAMNLIDGLDGQAGLISLFAFVFLGLHAIRMGKPLVIMVAFILLGSIIGFLLFNKPHAKIFMGDSGALFLGFTIAILPLSPLNGPISMKVLILPITLTIIPIVDTITAIIRRMSSRQKIHSADKHHVHHLLLSLGFSNWQILGIIFLYSFAISLISFFAFRLPHITYLLISAALWAVSFGLYYVVRRSSKHKVTHSQVKVTQ